LQEDNSSLPNIFDICALGQISSLRRDFAPVNGGGLPDPTELQDYISGNPFRSATAWTAASLGANNV
jgi:hypothetical protein